MNRLLVVRFRDASLALGIVVLGACSVEKLLNSPPTESVTGPPGTPLQLNQYRGDGETLMEPGGSNDSRAAVFHAVVTDPDAGQLVRLEVEVQPVGTDFTGTPTAAGEAVPRESRTSVVVEGLSDNTGFHWQARAVDAAGQSSEWVAYGGNGEDVADFVVTRPAEHISFAIQPRAARTGSPIAPAVEIAVLNGDGERSMSYSEQISISLLAPPSGGALSGNQTVRASKGVAVFSDLTIDRAGSGFVLRAQSGTMTALSDTFSVAPEGAAFLVFLRQPTHTEAGDEIDPSVRVAVRDPQGRTVTSYNGPVSVGIGDNPGGGRLSGRTTVTASRGIATFSDLSIDLAGTGYTLVAVAAGLPAVRSNGFNIFAGSATQLVFTVQPGDARVNTPITPPVQVTAMDEFGNVAPSFSSNVTMRIANDGSLLRNATLSGSTTVRASGGVATFTNLRIDRPGVAFTLRATSGGMSRVSAPFSVSNF